MNPDVQKQFVGWLAQKLQAKDEQDLKAKMQQLGNQGIKQAYQAFMQEQQQSSQGESQDSQGGVPVQKLGGKLDYIRCLQAFKKGGKMEMDKCNCNPKMQAGGEVSTKADKKDWLATMKKHQAGGNFIPANQPNLMQVQKADGSVGPWGNPVRSQPRMYALHPSAVSPIKQIDEGQLMHLRNTVPGFDRGVGQPMNYGEGQVQRFSPEQSDAIRKLMTTTPVPAPVGQSIAAKAKGGKVVKSVADHTMGKRTDSSTMVHQHGTRGDTESMTHQHGERNDKGRNTHTQGDRMDHNTMGHKKGDRKDASKMSWQTGERVENNKKKKDYVGFAKKGMSMDKCQDGGDLASDKKGGKISAAQQKDIQLKRMDAKKQMGGTMSPASTPANASQRMAGKGGKKKSMQAASMMSAGGLFGKK